MDDAHDLAMVGIRKEKENAQVRRSSRNTDSPELHWANMVYRRLEQTGCCILRADVYDVRYSVIIVCAGSLLPSCLLL